MSLPEAQFDWESADPQTIRFVEVYVNTGSQTKAERAAGFPPGNASKRLADPLVQALVAKRQKVYQDLLQVSAPTVIREYMAVAFAKITDVASWDADGLLQVKSSIDLSPEEAAAIKTLRVRQVTRTDKDGGATTTTTTELDLHNKLEALDKLSRTLGLFEQTPESDLVKSQRHEQEALDSMRHWPQEVLDSLKDFFAQRTPTVINPSEERNS